MLDGVSQKGLMGPRILEGSHGAQRENKATEETGSKAWHICRERRLKDVFQAQEREATFMFTCGEGARMGNFGRRDLHGVLESTLKKVRFATQQNGNEQIARVRSRRKTTASFLRSKRRNKPKGDLAKKLTMQDRNWKENSVFLLE